MNDSNEFSHWRKYEGDLTIELVVVLVMMIVGIEMNVSVNNCNLVCGCGFD